MPHPEAEKSEVLLCHLQKEHSPANTLLLAMWDHLGWSLKLQCCGLDLKCSPNACVCKASGSWAASTQQWVHPFMTSVAKCVPMKQGLVRGGCGMENHILAPGSSLFFVLPGCHNWAPFPPPHRSVILFLLGTNWPQTETVTNKTSALLSYGHQVFLSQWQEAS